MAVRVSEGRYLEILDQQPVAGVPIEVDVFDGASPGTMLATLEGAQAPRFTDPLGEEGSGEFAIPTADPKAVGSILREGNIVRFRVGGVHRYAIWLETPRKTVASTSGPSGERWNVQGRGLVTYLERAIVYPPGWPTPTGPEWVFSGATPGKVMGDLLAAAQARGTLPLLTWNFTDERDSDNDVWDADLSLTIRAGTSMLDVWRQLVAIGVDSEMTPDLGLRLWKDHSRHFEDTIIFRVGKHLAAEVESTPQGYLVRTRVLVEGQGGKWAEAAEPGLEGDPYIGRREGAVSFGQTDDPTMLQRVADASLDELTAAGEATAIEVFHGSGPGDLEPYRDYRNGDWVTLDVPGTFDLVAMRLRSVSLEATEGGDYRTYLDLNSVTVENIVRLKRSLDAMGGGSGITAISGATNVSAGSRLTDDGRVSVAQGDALGFLYDKIATAGSVSKALIGTGGARQVELSVPAAGAEGGFAPLSSGLLVPVAYLGSGTPDGTKFLRDDGTWHVPPSGGGGGISTVDQDISADFSTASDSAWHDITGLTGIVLAAGTWIGLIDLEVVCGASYGAPIRVWDGTTTYAQAELFYSSPVTAISNHWHWATKPLVLASSTTMAVQYFSDTAFTVKQYPSRGGLSSAIATHVTFLKVA